MSTSINSKVSLRLITSETNWLEGEAIRQLEKTAELPGMIAAVGLPELHPGKGIPVGAVFATEGVFYPYLVGNDVGCGMSLWRTDLQRRKFKQDKWFDRLNLESPLDADEIAYWLELHNIPAGPGDLSLGSIGGGNHFAELQAVERLEDEALFNRLELAKDKLVLLVHSGSRGLGEALLKSHLERYKAGGLVDDSEAAAHYLEKHHYAVKWAGINRTLIAQRFLGTLGAAGIPVLDLCHNSISKGNLAGRPCWLHRKGAVPSQGPTIIAGSRGALSYLVMPSGNQEECLYSITHGAGRKWKRRGVKDRLQSRYSAEALTHTDLGSRVICESKELLYEEAPQAYKDIETIVNVLRDAGLIRVIAALRPVITYKTKHSQ